MSASRILEQESDDHAQDDVSAPDEENPFHCYCRIRARHIVVGPQVLCQVRQDRQQLFLCQL